MNILYFIPARAGSKGLPGKNTKLLGNKPLIVFTLDFALQNIKKGDEICISTDDIKVMKIAKKKGIAIPFKRPEVLATDSASIYDVLFHSIDHYQKIGKFFDVVLLLQPTSPFRSSIDLEKMISIYNNKLDMVVSVKKTKENPYFNLFEENSKGFLIKSKKKNFDRRQDCPNIYAYNGSMYLINVKSLRALKIHDFKKIKKFLMPEERSVDIDTLADWALAEFYLNQI